MMVNKEVWEHLQKHTVYPTNRNEIIESCNKLMDIPQEDKERFEKYLPDWNYKNADEVIRAIQVVEHLEHVEYPTNKKELIKACNRMTDVSKGYREWFERSLPERTYNKRDEVIGTLKGITHVREHVNYPATKNLIVEGCMGMTEIPQTDKEWFEKNLPERTYKNAEDVIKAFKI